MKILVNTPDLSLRGGVSNHYSGLKPYWKMRVKYNTVGKRYGLPSILILGFDYVKFPLLCLFGGFDVVLLNPSLGKTALLRDAWFLRIAKWFKKKTVVFFHGWHPSMVKSISKQPTTFVKVYNRADGFLVLAKAFKDDLIRWGMTKPITLTTTKVDDALLKDFDIRDKRNKGTNLLFLTRIEEYKGVYIAVEAYQKAKAQYPGLTLTIAGDGSQLDAVQHLVKEKAIEDVEFLGHVSNTELVMAFRKADLYILPSFSEGMPTSVLEAMAFGLPIISRPVGGLVDFFEPGQMGYLLDSLDSKDFADTILELLQDPEKCKTIGTYNHNYAKQHFMASKVAAQLERIFYEL